MGGAVSRRLSCFTQGKGERAVEYVTVEREAADEFIEKKSRFIGACRPVKTEEEALRFIQEKKSRYWDASHNVFAYILREGNTARFSDDGEPQGTAGQPMLNVFQREGVVNVVCVVTRYFGGILLGAGGLVRAYSKAASMALEAAGRARMAEWQSVAVECSYAHYERLRRLLDPASVHE